jgi:hypothetical protein
MNFKKYCGKSTVFLKQFKIYINFMDKLSEDINKPVLISEFTKKRLLELISLAKKRFMNEGEFTIFFFFLPLSY